MVPISVRGVIVFSRDGFRFRVPSVRRSTVAPTVKVPLAAAKNCAFPPFFDINFYRWKISVDRGMKNETLSLSLRMTGDS